MFIDRVKVSVRAGNGGKGAISFHREKFVPMGGPDGGNGGHGGNVIFYVAPGETTLIQLHAHPHYEAEDGGNGGTNNRTGKDGQDVRLPVPPGTVLKDLSTGQIICELVDFGQEVIVAAGGKGGKGNASFATPIHQTPRTAQPGIPGEQKELLVELKMVADVGLVGFPNAGKSSLLNAITKAHARVGDYPFTTLHPVLGTLPLTPDEEAQLAQLANQTSRLRTSIILADIPGILEGANQGFGLGLEFLKHIERTKVLVFVLDASVQRSIDPPEAFRLLISEIGAYSQDLLERPRLIVLSKYDDRLADEDLDEIEEHLRKDPHLNKDTLILRVSSVSGEGLEGLRREVVSVVMQLVRQEIESPLS